jgi:hypothetical protein
VSLRELVARATPGPWKYHVEDLELTRDGDEPDPLVATRLIGEGISPEEGRLLALAPELAVLLADAMDELRKAPTFCIHTLPPHDSPGLPRNASECRVCRHRSLLARFAALDARAGETT